MHAVHLESGTAELTTLELFTATRDNRARDIPRERPLDRPLIRHPGLQVMFRSSCEAAGMMKIPVNVVSVATTAYMKPVVILAPRRTLPAFFDVTRQGHLRSKVPEVSGIE